jgi:hypothetical protein
MTLEECRQFYSEEIRWMASAIPRYATTLSVELCLHRQRCPAAPLINSIESNPPVMAAPRFPQMAFGERGWVCGFFGSDVNRSGTTADVSEKAGGWLDHDRPSPRFAWLTGSCDLGLPSPPRHSELAW